jgi:hypothetical protein
MTIQRPNCMKTLWQSSVSIPLSSAARCCAGRRPASGVGGSQDPAGGHEEGAAPITESNRFLGTLRCGSAAERRLGAAEECVSSVDLSAQIIYFCASQAFACEDAD